MIETGRECDQALFGWVEKQNQLGHQLVSTSSGVPQDEISYIQAWNLPVAINNVTYREGRRFFPTASGRYCLNLVKNIGKDLRGREGAMLSHFIIMDINTVRGTKGDFASMDQFLLHSVSSGRDLEKLRSKNGSFYELPKVRLNFPEEIHPDFETLRSTVSSGTLANIFYAVLINSLYPDVRVLLPDHGNESRHKFIWALLSVMPGDYRFLSFTTSLYDVRGDIPYNISVTGSINPSEFPDFSIVNLNGEYAQVPRQNEAISHLAGYLANLAASGNEQEILRFSAEYSRANTHISPPVRLLLALSDSFSRSGVPKENKLNVFLNASYLSGPAGAADFYQRIKGMLDSSPSDHSMLVQTSNFYSELLLTQIENPEEMKRTMGNMMDLLLPRPGGTGIFLSVMEPALVRMGTHAAETVADYISRRLLKSDLQVDDICSIIRMNSMIEKKFMERVYGGEMPSGGHTVFAKIMHGLDPDGKKFWDYISNLLEDSSDYRAISAFLKWTTSPDIASLLGQEQIFRLLKRIPKKIRKFSQDDWYSITDTISRATQNPPLSSILTRDQIKELDSMMYEDGESEEKTGLFKRKGK